MTGVTTGGAVTDMSTDGQNQLTAMGNATMGYDSAGNLITDDQGRTLIWDAWNRLVGVKGTNGSLVKAYTYDGMGRRITDGAGGPVTDYYLSASWQVLDEVSSGAVQANYLWAPSYVDGLVYRNCGLWDSYYATTDAAYNVTSIESAGTVAQRFVYSAYGTQTVLNASWSGTSDAYRWTVGHQGLMKDTATGLWYDRARWYSDQYMRAISADPLGYPDGANRYAMYAANPINFVDPSGLADAELAPYYKPNGQPRDPIDVYQDLAAHGKPGEAGAYSDQMGGLTQQIFAANFEKWNREHYVDWDCFWEYFDKHSSSVLFHVPFLAGGTGATAGALTTPFPKPLGAVPRGSGYTNLSHRLFGSNILKRPAARIIGMRTAATVGKVATKAIPVVGWGLLAWDLVAADRALTNCTKCAK
jgi:RHS repeat-associated protein